MRSNQPSIESESILTLRQESNLREATEGDLCASRSIHIFWPTLVDHFLLVDGEKSVTVTVEDRCAGCPGVADLDFTEAGFGKLAKTTSGRIHGVTWEWV